MGFFAGEPTRYMENWRNQKGIQVWKARPPKTASLTHRPCPFNVAADHRIDLRKEKRKMQMTLNMLPRLRGGGSLKITRTVSPSFHSLFSRSPPSRLLSGAPVDVVGDDLLLQHSPPPPVKPLIPTLLQPRVVVYDGVCHLCHQGVKRVIAADKHRKIKFCCLQSKAAEPYLRVCGLDREDVLRRFLFIEGPGLYHQASTAALRVLSYLPLPYSALSMLLIIPTPLRDAIYDYVAKRRYDWFGKEEDCLVLKEKEMLERFIDREEMLDQNRSDS